MKQENQQNSATGQGNSLPGKDSVGKSRDSNRISWFQKYGKTAEGRIKSTMTLNGRSFPFTSKVKDWPRGPALQTWGLFQPPNTMSSQQRLDWQWCIVIDPETAFSPEAVPLSQWTFLSINMGFFPIIPPFQSWTSCWWLQETVWNCGGTVLTTHSSCYRLVSPVLKPSSLFCRDPSSLAFVHWHLSVVFPTAGYRQGNLEVWPLCIRNLFPLIYPLFP